jgi:hypothetical protein
MPSPARLRPALLLLAALLPARTVALDAFEIQVYEDDVNLPGHVGLEVHLNYTARGDSEPAYAGEVPPDRVGRATLEPAVGVTEWLELGAYLQTMAYPGGARFGGWKARAKLVVPERFHLPLMLGLNAEIGKVPHAVEQQGWANEFRPIIGWRNADWLLVLNPIFGYALSGPDRFRVDLEPCGKAAWNTQRGFSVGVEYYAGLGFLDALLPVQDQEHLIFGVLDLTAPGRSAASAAAESPWELNLGLGAGLTSGTSRQLVAKAIVGRSF